MSSELVVISAYVKRLLPSSHAARYYWRSLDRGHQSYKMQLGSRTEEQGLRGLHFYTMDAACCEVWADKVR